jgi:predicted aspartyl protease
LGTFHVACTVADLSDRKAAAVPRLLVDTGSECTWIASDLLDKVGIKRRKKDQVFLLANGESITRSIGYALLRVQGIETVDEVVFAQPGDLQLLGARTLEGLNLAVDPGKKRLVAAGPRPAATGHA